MNFQTGLLPPGAIGVIGLGHMGSAITRALRRNGAVPAVLDCAAHPLPDSLAGLGLPSALSPAALAEKCELVLTCLPSSKEVREVTSGPDGLLSVARAGLIHIDHTSGEPAVARALHDVYQARHGAFVDAAMLRTPAAAEEGQLVLLLGGERATLDAIDGVLSLYSERRLHVGPVGAGHTLKLIASFIGLGAAALIAESYALMSAANLDARFLHEAITGSGADSGTFQAISAALLQGGAPGANTRKLSLGNAHRSVAALCNLALQLDATAPMATSAAAAIARSCAQFGEAAEISSLASLSIQRP